MKKVLFVATVVKTHIMEFHLPYLKLFKEHGWQTAVAARNDYEVAGECVIPYCDEFFDLPFERSPLKTANLRAYRELKRLIDGGEYDIVHCHTPTGGMLARLAARAARRHGTRVIYTAHGFHFYKGAPMLNRLVYYPAEKWLSRFTDDLITINREDLARAQSFHARRVHYIPGVGIDLSRFDAGQGVREDMRRRLGIPQRGKVVLSVGEVNENKNHAAAIEAVARLRRDDVYYIVCGRGPLAERHAERARELGIGGRVILTGYRTDVADFYAAADVFLFPSFREGLPVAVMEAMASGLPIVATKIRGNVDLIEDTVNGILVSPTDVDGMAAALARLLDADRVELSRRNRTRAEDFSLDRIVGEYADIYFGGERNG